MVMARNTLFILVATWAMAAGPTLCLAGVLDHACAPELHAEPCGADHDDAEDHCGDCNHESDCQNDPCVQVVRQDEDFDVAAEALSPVISITCYVGPALAQIDEYDPSPIDWCPSHHYRAGRPYPDRALPLLL